MNITVKQENRRVPVTVLCVEGAVDSATHQAFETQANQLIESGARYILVDLAQCSFVSSAGLRALHNIFNKLRALHKDVNDEQLRQGMSAGAYKAPYLKVVNLAPQIKDVFELSGFDVYIETFEDQDKALHSF
ncbi:MAG: STAS domain-containing protein [Anaerolineales bacterium]|nr:STAS domain-containing protein [Anaerolineales bacterium]